jgi:hypothetical protein
VSDYSREVRLSGTGPPRTGNPSCRGGSPVKGRSPEGKDRRMPRSRQAMAPRIADTGCKTGAKHGQAVQAGS